MIQKEINEKNYGLELIQAAEYFTKKKFESVFIDSFAFIKLIISSMNLTLAKINHDNHK